MTPERASAVVGRQGTIEQLGNQRPHLHRISADKIVLDVGDAVADPHEVVDLAQAVKAGIGVDADDDLGNMIGPAADGVLERAPEAHGADIGDLHRLSPRRQ